MHNTHSTELNVRNFGALGDGQTDDTRAFQAALDAAAQVHGTVVVPDGVYACSTLRFHDHIGLRGDPTWSYYIPGGAVLKLCDPAATCLLDLERCRGVRISGLCLLGEKLGTGIHGIWVAKKEKRDHEDFPAFERTMVSGFSGDGVRMDNIWCFSMRGCAIGTNHGDGLRMSGADGFISDTWISGNQGAGIRAQQGSGSTTVTANRIEWNRGGGILCAAAWNWNITGNCIDRAGGPGIQLAPAGRPEDGPSCHGFTVTGNTILRSGAPLWGRELILPHEAAGAYLDWCQGLVFTGNIINAGRDDAGEGPLSPEYGLVLGNLRGAVVRNNVLWHGATRQLVLDLGGHGEEVLIGDNAGALCPTGLGVDPLDLGRGDIGK